MMLVCSIQLYEYIFTSYLGHGPSRWIKPLILSIPLITVPIWVQIIAEYKHNKKFKFSQYSWPYIESVITLCVIVTNTVVAWPQALYTASELFGAYKPFHMIYLFFVSCGVLIWSVIVVSKKTKNNFWYMFIFSACLASPLLFFMAFRLGLIDTPLGVSALLFILLWSAKESSLLDVVPSAKSGVLNRIDVGVLVFNTQQQLAYSNEFASRLLNLDFNEQGTELRINGSELPERLIRPFDFDSVEPQKSLIELDKDSSGRVALKVNQAEQQSEPSNIYLDVTVEAIRNANSHQLLGHILLLQDVSEREFSRLKLSEKNQQLAALNQQKSDFFAGISHEFRTPLTLSIGVLSDTMNGDYGAVPAHLKPMLEDVKHNNQRLLNLVAQLLELSRLNQGQTMHRPEPLDLQTVLSSVIANFESLVSKQQIAISVDNQAKSTTLWFDPSALEKVLMNLISNAIKSIQSNGRITITLSKHDNQLLLSIKDTGHGIAKEVLPRIFEAFYYHENGNHSASNSTNDYWLSSTGIGLYMVKQLLEAHGASIGVVSTLELGSEFTLKFTMGQVHLAQLLNASPSTKLVNAQAQASKQVIEMQASEHAPEFPDETLNDDYSLATPEPDTEKLVLVVEDNVQMRRYIRHHLAKEFRLIEAEDGEEGYALAQQSVPDLILSDLMMPKLNGLELSEKIRSTDSTSHIPIVLLTAKSDSNDKLTGLSVGVDDYITKPFDAPELVARIHNLIASRQHLLKRFSRAGSAFISVAHTNDNDSQNPNGADNAPDHIDQEAVFLENLRQYMLTLLTVADTRISAIAEHFNMSERSLQRKINAVAGVSPKQYLTSLRLEEAQNRLIKTNHAITSIALETGFSDAPQFSRIFKAHYKLTPLEFRKHYTQLS